MDAKKKQYPRAPYRKYTDYLRDFLDIDHATAKELLDHTLMEPGIRNHILSHCEMEYHKRKAIAANVQAGALKPARGGYDVKN